ncbi:MAG: hypothetical protein CVT86_01230 [Alphaproteobacteria bacterium HGW-Alphaproteobacteria-8]|nr:MAG: hypothetical protein CVT86_01230 [Alphaproteobacteria bacterium HGW-Alphaproteobacteria-8]
MKMMQDRSAVWARIAALCVCLIVAFSLAVAPAIEAVKHGPGAMAATGLARWLPKPITAPITPSMAIRMTLPGRIITTQATTIMWARRCLHRQGRTCPHPSSGSCAPVPLLRMARSATGRDGHPA